MIGMHAPSIPSPQTAEAQLRLVAAEEIEDQTEAAVIHRAAEVLGDRSDAMRWLGTPVRALNYATPISLLHDSKGREDVLTVLGRLEHGIL
jgi:putative toxin-antitoxin system antitoxin component (TIGR02293 family)